MIALNGSIFEWPGLRVSGHVAAEHALLTVQDELEPSGLLTHTAVLCALFGATGGRAQTSLIDSENVQWNKSWQRRGISGGPIK